MYRGKIGAYLSGWIRGPATEGTSGRVRSIEENIAKACGIGHTLRDEYSDILQLYIPHEWEHLLDFDDAEPDDEMGEEILRHDGDIVKLCDVMILVDDPDGSQGMQYELTVAEEHGIDIIHAYSEEGAVSAVGSYLHDKGVSV